MWMRWKVEGVFLVVYRLCLSLSCRIYNFCGYSYTCISQGSRVLFLIQTNEKNEVEESIATLITRSDYSSKTSPSQNLFCFEDELTLSRHKLDKGFVKSIPRGRWLSSCDSKFFWMETAFLPCCKGFVIVPVEIILTVRVSQMKENGRTVSGRHPQR